PLRTVAAHHRGRADTMPRLRRLAAPPRERRRGLHREGRRLPVRYGAGRLLPGVRGPHLLRSRRALRCAPVRGVTMAGSGERAVRELVVISGKGGTGKTSVTASFAVLAGRAVVADCDVDAA